MFLYRAMELEYQNEGYLPLEQFFRIPETTEYKISPNGEYLAYLAPWEDRLNLFVQRIGAAEGTRITGVTDRNMASFLWANDSTLLYPMDDGGDENYHLYRIGIDGSGNKDLTPYDQTRAAVLTTIQDNDNEILVLLNKRNPEWFDVYRLNIMTGAMTLSAENPGTVTNWVADHSGKVRAAISTDGETTSVLYREKESASFRPMLTLSPGDMFQPVMFTADNKQLYVLTNIDKDKTELVIYDPSTHKVVQTLYAHPEVDITEVLLSQDNQKLLAAIYERDKTEYHFFEKDLEQLQKTLESKLPGKSISMTEFSKDGNMLVFSGYGDTSPGSYYLFDRKTGTTQKIADSTPWIDESKLAETRPISYKARDGLTIHGYLTIPKNKEAKNLPVVVYPHGGPWARDSWGYSPVIQFMANRGYAIFQMNYRGSTGYGKAFVQAGKKQWGKAMQDDITDGVNWLIDATIADPKRIAICGISYGGYAALAGLAFTPDLYAAGVDFVGPSNLITFLKTIPPYWKAEQQMLNEHVGDPIKDEIQLKEISPLFHVDQIKAPLFVAQGANDPRVNIAESNQIVKALQDRGIEVPYMIKDNEGHGYYNAENQFHFYKAVEKFLHEHLK
ncbi:peptidase [Bacillus sp. FJAT-27264]|nr:peptidase [Bacillus sp. FJAT-27264]